MRAFEFITEAEKTLKLPDMVVGDEVKVGKFKNRKAEIKGFKKDDHGQPVLKTTKGDQKLFKPRISKLEPKKIDESFDSPYSYEWSDQTRGAWRGRFRTTSNDYVDVDIENFKEKWSIEFSRNDNHKVTGGGDAMRIFSTVISMIDEFISIQSPMVVKFSADKSKSGSDSRSKLYSRMIKRFASTVGYTSQETVEDGKTFYILTHNDSDLVDI